MAKKTSSSRKRSRPVSQKKKSMDKNILILAGIAVIIIVAVAGVLLLGSDNNDNTNSESNGDQIAIIETSEGTIKVDLYEDKTPNTVQNFINYAEDSFYDGLVFHRVANLDSTNPDTHIIQGGGFYPDGTRKETNDPIDLEIHPDARHIDGAIAMARTSDPNSATSQFYICDGPQSFLDDNYAVFGIVTDGMDVVRSIARVDTTTKNGMQNWPVEDVIINSITIQYE